MNSIDMFLVQYGLAAIFILMLVKSIGVPIPIPGDLIVLTAAARVAQGKLVLWQAFTAILVALILGGLVQFWLARGPGRSLLYRFGRYIGLTSARLDAADAGVKKGMIFQITHVKNVPDPATGKTIEIALPVATIQVTSVTAGSCNAEYLGQHSREAVAGDVAVTGGTGG
jgi:hypothetical protein